MPKSIAKDIKPQRGLIYGLTHDEAFAEIYQQAYKHALDAVLESMKGIDFKDPACQVTPEMVVKKLQSLQSAWIASRAIAKASST